MGRNSLERVGKSVSSGLESLDHFHEHWGWPPVGMALGDLGNGNTGWGCADYIKDVAGNPSTDSGLVGVQRHAGR